MDPLGLRTNLIRTLGLTTNVVVVRNDKIGQITSWSAQEMGMGCGKTSNSVLPIYPVGQSPLAHQWRAGPVLHLRRAQRID